MKHANETKVRKEKDNQYRVRWEIDIWAGTPEQAALEALKIMRKTDSTATCFDVMPVSAGGRVQKSRVQDIDLMDHAVCGECGHVFKVEKNTTSRLNERVMPGGLVPVCECPKCWGFAYPALKMIE